MRREDTADWLCTTDTVAPLCIGPLPSRYRETAKLLAMGQPVPVSSDTVAQPWVLDVSHARWTDSGSAWACRPVTAGVSAGIHPRWSRPAPDRTNATRANPAACSTLTAFTTPHTVSAAHHGSTRATVRIGPPRGHGSLSATAVTTPSTASVVSVGSASGLMRTSSSWIAMSTAPSRTSTRRVSRRAPPGSTPELRSA